jgi:hypothetical protein
MLPFTMIRQLLLKWALLFFLHKFLEFTAADKPFGKFRTISAVCLASHSGLSFHTVYFNLYKMLINSGIRTVNYALSIRHLNVDTRVRF